MVIELGGKNRVIRYDYNALADLEQAGGASIATLFSNQDNLGFNFIRLIVWAGLKHAEPGFTIQRAGMLIQKHIDDGGDLGTLTKTFLEALQKSSAFGKSDDEKNV
jgi:hypothetical protein